MADGRSRSAFKYGCRSRIEKLEKRNLKYALTAEVIREGGLKMAIMVRYSSIPGHSACPSPYSSPSHAPRADEPVMCTRAPVITALFATCGVSVWTFLIAAFLSLPKQFATVYLGFAENIAETGQGSLMTTIVKVAIVTTTGIVTYVAMRYVNKRIDAIKGRFIYERRKARCVSFARERWRKRCAHGYRAWDDRQVNLAGGNVPPTADPEDPATAPLVGGSMSNVTSSHPSHDSPLIPFTRITRARRVRTAPRVGPLVPTSNTKT